MVLGGGPKIFMRVLEVDTIFVRVIEVDPSLAVATAPISLYVGTPLYRCNAYGMVHRCIACILIEMKS